MGVICLLKTEECWCDGAEIVEYQRVVVGYNTIFAEQKPSRFSSVWTGLEDGWVRA